MLKREALRMGCKFIQDVAIPLGLQVDIFRSDNDGIYTAQDLHDYCKIKGIQQQFTAP